MKDEVKLTVIKFSPATDGKLYNYFDLDNNNTCEDKIVIDQFIRSKIPSYRKETTGRTDFFQVKSGGYDIELKMSVDCESDEGDDIYDFFSDLYKTKLMAILEIGDIEETGFIDIPTITKFLTASNYEFNISFTTHGILEEFWTYYETRPILKFYTGSTYYFEAYWQYHFGNDGNVLSTKVSPQCNSFIDWYKVGGAGFIPKVNTYLQNNIYDHNQGTDICNVWKTFKESMIQLGLVYEFVRGADIGGGYYNFYLNIFQRSVQRTLHTIKIEEHQESLDLPDVNGWVMSRNHEYILPISTYQYTIANGILFNDTETKNFVSYSVSQGDQFLVRVLYPNGTVSDHFVGIYSNGVFHYFLSDDTEVLNIPHDRYSVGVEGTLFKAGVVMYSRIFVNSYHRKILPFEYWDTGSDTILEKLMMPEYKFLLRGLKKTKKLKVKFDTAFKLFDHFVMPFSTGGIPETYWINRMGNLDLEKMTIEIEGVEI